MAGQSGAGRVRAVVFDLSEVLVSGLVGVERRLAPLVGWPPGRVLQAFGGEPLRELCRGQLTEEQYLTGLAGRTGWGVGPDELRKHVRANFHWKIAGMRELVQELSRRHALYVYSDHAREWVEYLSVVHPFLGVFRKRVFSFDIGKVKDEPGAFAAALERLGLAPRECVFVDDSPVNVEAARNAGVCAVRFLSTAVLRAALAAQGVRPGLGRKK